MRPEVNGRILQLPVDIGDSVRKGDLLFQLDDRDLQIEKESRQKEIERAKLGIEQAERNYVRSQALFNEFLISKELFEDTKTLYELAKNTLGRAEKAMELVEDRLRKTRITAPFDCTVLTRPVSVGQAVSGYLHERQPQHARSSLLAAAGRLGIPVTVHVAIGTDIIHMHPAASGAALGEGSLRDFRYFVSNVARLERGVFLNCGSAVVLPEVFLKAVALARNRGLALDGLTTVNLDFIRGYRPQTNVVSRPTAGTSGRGYSLIGHHELMIPLLAAAILRA